MDGCRHCRRTDVPLYSRGLCSRCGKNPAIRVLYPAKYASTRSKDWHEPTEAELDALIAQQMPTLPPKEREVGEKKANAEPRLSMTEKRIVRWRK